MDRTIRRTFASLAALVLVLAAAGCARPVGDFGRADPDPLHDKAMPAIGGMLAHVDGKPASSFNLTDQERLMRDRVWRYLVSPHAFDWFADTLAELQRTRLIPLQRKALKTDKYYAWLRAQEFASSRVRYSRVADDVTADLAMLPDAFASICAVIEVDRQRDVAAHGVAGLAVSVDADVTARRAENLEYIDWFVRALANRYDSYSYALDHLLVETPHEEAVRLDGLLSELAMHVDAAEASDFCSPRRPTMHATGDIELPSRVLRIDPEAALPPK